MQNPGLTIKFDLIKMTDDQQAALRRAEQALSDAGIHFDTGTAYGREHTRDWEFDWSLQGPVSVEISDRTKSGPVTIRPTKPEVSPLVMQVADQDREVRAHVDSLDLKG